MTKLVFGNGTLLITTTWNSLVIRQLKSKMEVGTFTNTTDVETGDVTMIHFRSYSDVKELKDKVKNAYEQHVFIFDNVEFDFSNYSRSSVDYLLDQITWVERFIVRSVVC